MSWIVCGFRIENLQNAHRFFTKIELQICSAEIPLSNEDNMTQKGQVKKISIEHIYSNS